VASRRRRKVPAPSRHVVTLAPQTVTLTRELPAAPTRFSSPSAAAGGWHRQGTPVHGGRHGQGRRAALPTRRRDLPAEHASAKAALARAEATLNTARLNARRSAELVAINAVSRQEDENAVAALKQAEADVAAAEAALQRAGVVLGYARITSPITGRSASRRSRRARS